LAHVADHDLATLGPLDELGPAEAVTAAAGAYDDGVSVVVAIERLREEVARYGPNPFILTVSEDGRPHAVSAAVAWEGDDLVGGCGRSTAVNAAARPEISLLWPPADPGGYSLIVDGTASVADQQVRLHPSRAVLHRSAPSPDPSRSCSSDCVPIMERDARVAGSGG
jgi:hypothetical protein